MTKYKDTQETYNFCTQRNMFTHFLLGKQSVGNSPNLGVSEQFNLTTFKKKVYINLNTSSMAPNKQQQHYIE